MVMRLRNHVPPTEPPTTTQPAPDRCDVCVALGELTVVARSALKRSRSRSMLVVDGRDPSRRRDSVDRHVVEDSFGDVDDGADLGEVVADVVGMEFGGVDLWVLGVVSLAARPVEG